MAFIGLMKPAAGVTATRPTTMAVAAPTAVAFPCRIEVEQRPDDERAGRREHRRREREARRCRWPQARCPR